MSAARSQISTLPIIMGGVVVAGIGAVAYLFRAELGLIKKTPPPPPPVVVMEKEDEEKSDEFTIDVDVGGITNASGIFYVPIATQSERMKKEAAEQKALEEKN